MRRATSILPRAVPVLLALVVATGAAVPAGADPTPNAVPAAAPVPAPVAAPAAAPDIPVENVMAHLNRFQSIATANGGNRAHGRPGFRASADYVKGALDAAGFTTVLQPFTTRGATGWNVIAEWPHGDPAGVVMAGAHLDSVTAGPGISDNGSGSAAVLEVALAVARADLRPQKRLRFGWWGAEELGLVGSKHYADTLPATERAKINAYLNFDMVGQKDITTWGVYNQNAGIAAHFTEYFRAQGIATTPISWNGSSDHSSFTAHGIPVGGIGSGSDPCYHSACDTIANVGPRVVGHSTNAIAHTVWKLAGVGAPTDDFALTVSPTSADAMPGNTTTTTVRTTTTAGQPQQLALTATGLPTGATATFTPQTVTAGQSASLSIAVATSSPPGVYPVVVRATAGSTSRTTTYTVTIRNDAPTGCRFTNGADVPIADNATAESAITLTGCTGAASATSTVAVQVQHTYQGDLVVSLLAPDGTPYVLHNRSGGGADNLDKTYTLDLRGESADGRWRLRVEDRAAGDTGKIDGWTLDLRPPTPAAVAPAVIEERVYVETQVDTDGNGRLDRVAIDIARPGGGARVPVVFEHSPYVEGLNNAPNHNPNVDRLPQEGLFGAASADPGAPTRKAAPDLPGWYDGYFVPKGYAVVMGQSIGTGASDGCPSTGDRAETLGATAVVDWLNGRAKGFSAAGAEVAATWSTGNVGMIGISYNGTLPNAAAAAGVPGLKAVVPIAAISSWYDYYRANGLVVAPGGYQGEDADVLAKAVVGDATRCAGKLAALTREQDRVTGDLTPFWQQRDYVRDADKVSAAVFVMHGQTDWNVKGEQYAQWWDALRANGVPRKIWLHRGGHGAPSRSDYQATVLRWFDQHLKGIDTGILAEPKADVQLADGTWHQFADWPDPAARDAVLHLGATSATAPGTLSTTGPGGDTAQSFTDIGRTANATTLSANPDQANANRLVYRAPTLTADAKMSGTPRVTLRTAVQNRKDANVTALLVDYGGSSPVIVTRGWIDPQNRAGPSTGQAVVEGQEYDLTFALQPRDYVFAAGHRIGLVVISTDYEFTLRPTAGTTLRLAPARSTLTVPLTGISPPANDFTVAVAPTTGTVVPGGSTTATVTTTTTSGAAQPLALSATGLPAGATATFTPANPPSGQSSALAVTTSAATPPGSYPVTVTAQGATAKTTAYTLVVRAPGGCAATSTTPVAIPDRATVESQVTISGCTAAPSATSAVDVDIQHTYQGDLVVTLLAPDGTAYVLHNRTGGSADNLVRSYPLDLAGEAANGTWKLRVQDAASGDTGTLRRWTLDLTPTPGR